MNKYVLIVLVFCMPFLQLNAQNTTPVLDSNSKLIEFLSAESYNVKKIDSTNFVILVGNVKIRQGKTLLYGDSLVLNTTLNTLEGFGKIHINDADSVHTYADYLKYLGNDKKAFLRRKVKLTDGKGILTTDSLDYDVSIKLGKYNKGGKLIRNNTILKSVEGYYYGVTRDIIFRNKVELIDPENKIYTDTLEYNTYSQLANFISPTKIISGARIIKTNNGNYNLGSKKGYLYERSSIDDSSYTFIADEMAIDDSLGLGEFRGNAFYRSKDSSSFDLMANNIKTNRNKNILLATELPILVLKQKKDSIYISADTLYSAALSDLKKSIPPARSQTGVLTDSSLNKYFEAFHHVTIYSDSLQARADSLFYSLADSTIRLLSKPIVWASGNQITGDTIYLFLNNKQPEQLSVFNNAFAINKVDTTQYFNQIKGNRLNVFFEEGTIQKMRTSGNAENLYFVLDDAKNFIGVNHSSAQIIEISFEEGTASKVKFINQLQGKLNPINKIAPEELQLRTFKWWEQIRPQSKYEILSPTSSKP